MARPITWLGRLHEIRKSVAGSVRSHYTRAELEVLFQVQQGAASRLMEVIPTLKVNGSYLAEREGLLAFLDRISEAEDVTTLMRRLREEKKAPARRSIRTMIRRDQPEVSVAGIPDTLKIERGQLQIRFKTMEELVNTLYILARILDDDLEAFTERYEPIQDKVINEAAEEVRRMFEELEDMEAARSVSAVAPQDL